MPIIAEAIEDVLEVYPQAAYRQMFASRDARQDLIAYVLSRFPSTYAVMEDELVLENITTPYCSQEQRMKLEALIHQAIQYYSHKSNDAVNHSMSV
nr:late competence development ComFB family protein [Oculatella sp. LEGE 06141]